MSLRVPLQPPQVRPSALRQNQIEEDGLPVEIELTNAMEQHRQENFWDSEAPTPSRPPWSSLSFLLMSRGGITFEHVQREEHDVIKFQRILRGEAAQQVSPRQRLALAFSGGGMKAAAFQCGVLWRLAQQGILKDVDYFVAVSGGGYISAAYISHLLEAGKPDFPHFDCEQQDEGPDGDSAQEEESEGCKKERKRMVDKAVDRFYLDVVAETICRMQKNAGNFIRDPAQWNRAAKRRQRETRGSREVKSEDADDVSCESPRFLDSVIVTIVLAITLMVNPIAFMLLYLVPIMEVVNIYFGAGLRSSFCTANDEFLALVVDGYKKLVDNSILPSMAQTIQWVMPLVFFVWLLKFLPCFKPKKREQGGGDTKSMYLFMNSLRALGARVILISACVMVAVVLAELSQWWSYGEWWSNGEVVEQIPRSCIGYVQCTHLSAQRFHCEDLHGEDAWFKKLMIGNKTLEQWALEADPLPNPCEPQVPSGKWLPLDVIVLLGVGLGIALLLAPIVPELVFLVFSLAGPIIVLCFVSIFIQYRVFGPMTGQALFFNRYFRFNREQWGTFLRIDVVIILFLVPCYNNIRNSWHQFYCRTLRNNFFRKGKDVSMRSLLGQPWCPFVLYTGTVNDYRQPGAEQNISEMSFSPLHEGGEAIGYLRAPRFRTLAKCTALTGAGCLDALSLSIGNTIRYRIWLELLNLCWGDYILFLPMVERLPFRVKRLQQRMTEGPWRRRVSYGSIQWLSAKISATEGPEWIFRRLPTITILIAVVTLFWISVAAHESGIDAKTCNDARTATATFLTVLGTTLALSFFSYMPHLRFLMFSAVIRQVHQVTQFFFEAYRPPGLLYITDGGVQDCTGVIQLLRRRCERIFLVLGAADPEDDLNVLRKTLDIARRDQLCSFFDPDEPRREVVVLLDKFKADKNQTYLRIGIYYGSQDPLQPATVGMLVAVACRLPPALTEDTGDRFVMRPLLTESEVRSGHTPVEVSDEHDSLLKMNPEDLGGLGSCDFFHRWGLNCGRKFPKLWSTAYLWLTPQNFNCLCRLGREISGDALDALAPATPMVEEETVWPMSWSAGDQSQACP